jgi:uncharacterized RDD family membrane protein YckC
LASTTIPDGIPPGIPNEIPADPEAGAPVFRAAAWVPKVLAAGVDAAVALALCAGFVVVQALELPEAESSPDAEVLTGIDRLVDAAAQHAGMVVEVFLAVALAAWLYEALSVTLLGRTAGQALMGLRLVRLDGQPLGTWRPLLRGVLVAAGLLPLGAGWVWAPFDPRRQAAHDRWAGMLLVEDHRPGVPAPLSAPAEVPETPPREEALADLPLADVTLPPVDPVPPSPRAPRPAPEAAAHVTLEPPRGSPPEPPAHPKPDLPPGDAT